RSGSSCSSSHSSCWRFRGCCCDRGWRHDPPREYRRHPRQSGDTGPQSSRGQGLGPRLRVDDDYAAAMPTMTAVIRDPAVARALGRRRRRVNRVMAALAILATTIGLLLLASILFTLLWEGVGGLRLTVFTHMTLPPGSNGGLLNAIVGTVIQTGLGTLIGTPLGLLVGTYLAEYGGQSPLASTVRFVSDVLLSAPS